MPKFLCLQRSLSKGTGEKPTPAQMQEMYAKFGAWQAKFEENILDMGGRIGAGTFVSGGTADGPFVEVKELIGGYMVVQADSLEEAVEVAKGCPGLVGPNSGVEVVEIHGP